MTIVSENAKNFMRNCLFMGGDYNCSESIWMDEFEKGRSVKDSYSYVPRGERKAGETLNPVSYTHLLSFAMAGDPLTKEQAQRIASLYFEYEVGVWQEIIPNFWVRKDADDCFTAAVVYPDIKGHAFCYCFSANLKEYTNAQIQAYEEACPPPEHVINLELRKVYSILASLDLSKATDRYVAANQEDLELWLKKCGIQREAR